jgi:flagellar hook-length control protein FliK
MPTLATSPGPSLTLTTALTPVAANPIASVGPGASDGFAAVIGGVAPAGLTLDAPPTLPETGTALPPARPEFAGPLPPLPVLDVEQPAPTAPGPSDAPPLPVEQVMLGSLPAPIAAHFPARAAPAAPAVAADPALPAETPKSDTDEAPMPGAKPWTPPAPSPALRARFAPDRPAPTVRNMPALVEAPAQAPEQSATSNVPTMLAPGSTSTDLRPVELPEEPEQTPVPLDASCELAPPVAIPMPAPIPSTSPRPVVLDQPDGAVAAPVVVLPMPVSAGTRPLPTPVAVKLPVGDTPAEPASTDAKAAPAPATIAVPAQAPAPRPDFAIPPELARQVAQIVRPVVVPDEPVTDVPAADFAPLPPVAVPQPVFSTPTPIAHPTQSAPIDLGRAEWMQSMIDRIGDIVQEGGRREALIRLLPDALGAVEVKIIERDDRLQVTLNADTAQARQLLSEQAPRLAELAEARGLRFAQTDIGGGAPQQQERRPAPEQPNTPLRPRSARTEPDPSTPDHGDRIA